MTRSMTCQSQFANSMYVSYIANFKNNNEYKNEEFLQFHSFTDKKQI